MLIGWKVDKVGKKVNLKAAKWGVPNEAAATEISNFLPLLGGWGKKKALRHSAECLQNVSNSNTIMYWKAFVFQ